MPGAVLLAGEAPLRVGGGKLLNDDPVRTVRRLVDELGVVVSLKGSTTYTCAPDGRVFAGWPAAWDRSGTSPASCPPSSRRSCAI